LTIQDTHSDLFNSSNELSWSENSWIEIRKDEGITHYSQQIKGCNLNAYKGVCIINKSIETIYSLLMDVPSHPTWVAYCTSSSVIKRFSHDDAIQYYNFDVPWPFFDRDIVVHCMQKTEKLTGTITIDSYALRTPLVPLKKKHLRITDARQKWVIEQIGPEKTRITFIALTNIEGQAPNVLKKLISQVIPSTSLENLRAVSMKQNAISSTSYIAKSDYNKIK
jgi:ribosome-associated toxin RatA of RatAB toxin-antitoxin module